VEDGITDVVDPPLVYSNSYFCNKLLEEERTNQFAIRASCRSRGVARVLDILFILRKGRFLCRFVVEGLVVIV